MPQAHMPEIRAIAMKYPYEELDGIGMTLIKNHVDHRGSLMSWHVGRRTRYRSRLRQAVGQWVYAGEWSMASTNLKIETGARAFPNRLRRTAEVYCERIRDDGGWGLAPDQPSSLVNTGEVIAILEAGGTEYEDEHVQRGLSYLTSNLERHLKDLKRGPRTRYAVFSLLGLTEYPQARERDDVREAITFVAAWLRDENRVGDGWCSQSGNSTLSLFATCTAISALRRAKASDPTIAEGVRCIIANSLTASTWPPAAERSDHPSPAVTGLAAMTLFDAGHTRAAKAASRWLVQSTAKWATRTEEAREEQSWRHMTFSICARAVLRGGIPLYDPRLRPTLRYMSSLWSQREGLWSDGAPDHHLTVRGAYAAALFYQELRRSMLAQDPLSLAEALQPDGETGTGALAANVEMGEKDGTLIFTTVHGLEHTIELDRELFAIVTALIENGPMERRALGKLLTISAPDVQSQINLLNVAVWRQTEGEIGIFVHHESKGYVIRLGRG
jgi:hypothetical protein